jgi:glycosyltransferase involved in cell wall biosynthesis
MPYYKHLKTIKRALQSVLTQLEQDFEIIIIDDGSKDNVLSLINEFNDKRIMYLKSEHLGVSHARNLGIKQAKGNYICFLDSDDFYMNHHLAVLKKQIDRNPYYNFFVTNHHQLSKKSNPFKALNFKDEILKVKNYFEFTLNKMEVIHTNSVCIKKEVLKDHLFEEGISHGEDHDLWCRLAIFNEIIFINHVTTVYDNQESILTNIKEVPRWVFIDRQDHLNQLNLDLTIKKNLNQFIERKKLSEVRKLIRYQRIHEAKLEIKSINSHQGFSIQYWITKILLILLS